MAPVAVSPSSTTPSTPGSPSEEPLGTPSTDAGEPFRGGPVGGGPLENTVGGPVGGLPNGHGSRQANGHAAATSTPGNAHAQPRPTFHFQPQYNHQHHHPVPFPAARMANGLSGLGVTTNGLNSRATFTPSFATANSAHHPPPLINGHHAQRHGTASNGSYAVGPLTGLAISGAATTPEGFVDTPRTSSTSSPPPPQHHGARVPAPDASSQPLMPIAVVGLACRLPGDVSSPAEFWEMCARARSGFSAIPPETRFNPAPFYHPNPGKSGTFNPEGGNFLKGDLGLFDAPFFSMTAQEATSLDPQQRLLLECTFEALENAGVPKHSIVGKDVGVFVGGSFSEYESSLFRDTDYIAMHQATGKCILLY